MSGGVGPYPGGVGPGWGGPLPRAQMVGPYVYGVPGDTEAEGTDTWHQSTDSEKVGLGVKENPAWTEHSPKKDHSESFHFLLSPEEGMTVLLSSFIKKLSCLFFFCPSL